MSFDFLRLLSNYRSSTFRLYCDLFMALVFATGCATGQFISQEKLQEQVGKIQVGFTTQKEIENLFGKPYLIENRSWTYSLSDTGLENSPRIVLSSEQSKGLLEQVTFRLFARVIPIPKIMPTNTRALVTVRFNENDTVNALEVAQFFNVPFVNYYHFFLDRVTDGTLESVMRAGEMSNFHAADFDKSTGRFLLLEKGASDARIIVKLENQILHITSMNPYDRLSNEYRLFRRSETQLIERISAATVTDAKADARR